MAPSLHKFCYYLSIQPLLRVSLLNCLSFLSFPSNGMILCENSHSSQAQNHQICVQSEEATSRDSSPPLNSRTSSSNGWDHTLHSLPQSKTSYSYQYQLGDDGLVPLRSVVQERLDQIIEEQKVVYEEKVVLNVPNRSVLWFQKKEEILQREVQVLSKQICQKCNHNDNERQDDNVSIYVEC